jgi:hypothetical protein
MADREGWESLCAVLNDVETKNHPEHTEKIFIETLAAIRDRLQGLTFRYVLPDRISLKQAETLTKDFLAEKSGGDRGLAVAAAIFEAIRYRFGDYLEIRRGMINAADAATKSAGDLECVGSDGQVVVAAEVKDRRIRLDDIQAALAKAREVGVKELIFFSHGIIEKEFSVVEESITTAWASGTNIYCVTIGEFLRNVFPLVGEQGIKSYVIHVGNQLDKFNTQPKHRKAWKDLLDGL